MGKQDKFELVPVENLKPGDLIDLLNDQYADPPGSRDRSRHMALEDTPAEVEGIEIETPGCTVVYTDIASNGFPHGYKVKRVTPGSSRGNR